jgi:hypothetical protein
MDVLQFLRADPTDAEGRSRDETLLTFAGREDALTIGRLPAVRLREILGTPYQGDDGAGRE